MKAIGVNLKFDGWIKRLWFEVPEDEAAMRLFDQTCDQIDSIKAREWREFLMCVERLFTSNGFFRIAR